MPLNEYIKTCVPLDIEMCIKCIEGSFRMSELVFEVDGRCWETNACYSVL